MIALRLAVVAAFSLLTSAASALSVPLFQGVVYDEYVSNDIATVETFLATTSELPVISFETSTIPTFGSFSTLASRTETVFNLLGAPASGFTGSTTKLYPSSVFVITGFVDLSAGNHNFRMAANDGFRVTIDGNDVISNNTQGNFTSTAAVAGGVMPFRLLYWNNATEGKMVFSIDGDGVSAAAAPIVQPPVTSVPVPAAGLLAASAFGLLGLVGRRRRA